MPQCRLSPEPRQEPRLSLVAKDGRAVDDAAPKGRTLTGESPLIVLPGLACEVGLPEAVFLQQVHYLSTHGFGQEREGHRWVFNSYEGWHRTFPFLSVDAIGRMIRKLAEKGLIDVTARFNASSLDQRRWYRVRYDHPCLAGLRSESANSQIGDSAKTQTDSAPAQIAPANSQNADANSQIPARVVQGVKTTDKDFKTETAPLSPPKGGARTRPVPLSADFAVTEEMRTWAVATGLPAGNIDLLTDTMRDWAASKRVVRADWVATWRNFVRREVSDLQRRRPGNGHAPPANRADRARDEMDALLRIGGVSREP